jgi:hypothetical protein
MLGYLETQNRACFEHKLIKNPNELISFAVVFMNYWAGLHNSPDAENLRTGAASLLQLATGAPVPSSAHTNAQPGGILRIADATMEDPAADRMETDD